MIIDDPDTTVTVDVTPDPADGTVEVVIDTPAKDETPNPLDALEAGIAVANGDPPKEAEPVEPVPGTAEALAAEEAKAAAAKIEAEKPVDPEVEIATLGLKERAAARFREQLTEIKTLRTALETAGIKDVAELPALAQRAKERDELIGFVKDTGTTPEQYGRSLDYLSVTARAQKGDRAAAEQAYAIAAEELATWAGVLGKEVPGVHDPLAAHKDLIAEIETGDLTRERALEIAGQRQALQRQAETSKATQTASEHEAASDHGKLALNALGAQLSASDPDYARKVPFLLPSLELIKRTMHPSQWVQATHEAYAQIPALPAVAAAPANVPVTGVPMRPTGARPGLRAVPKDAMEALDFGIAQANSA